MLNTCLGTDAELRPRKQGRQDKAMYEEEAKANFKGKFVVADPIGILKEGLRSVRHHTFGWLRDDLLASGKLDGQKESLYSRVWSDYSAQLIYVRAQKDILGDDFDPLHCVPGRDSDGKFTFTKNVDVPKNHLTLAYLLHAYGMDQSTFKRLRLRGGEALTKQVPHNKGRSIVSDQQYAATIFTPRYFFVQSQMKKWTAKNKEATVKRKRARRQFLRKQWDENKAKDPDFGPAYDKRSRDHNERHKGAKDDLIDLLNRNGRRSYSSLGKALNNWCSASTVERFLKSNHDYLTYSQNVRPLLSEGNRLKQVTFSKHVQNRWGLVEGTKILWTMRYN
jgi:hypothetical protein